jgi:hypothetical protein
MEKIPDMADTTKKGRNFEPCATGFGLGLLAIVITFPLWGLYGFIFISRLSPLLAFSIVFWKICSAHSIKRNKE